MDGATDERRHGLIFDAVKTCLTHGAPGLGDGIRSAIASAAALRVARDLDTKLHAPAAAMAAAPTVSCVELADPAGADFIERRIERMQASGHE
jgi:hypothetical protein